MTRFDDRFAGPTIGKAYVDTVASDIIGHADQRSRDLSLTALPLAEVTDTSEVRRPLDVLADGYIYGFTGNVIYRSSDGKTWDLVRSVGTGAELTALRDAGDGEVLLARFNGGMFKSSGWADDPTTATFSLVQGTTGSAYILPWAVDTNPETGVCVFTEYLAGSDWTDSRKVYLSTDAGDTWTVVYDLDTEASDNANSHMHVAAIDPWADDRLWIAWHHKTNLADKHLLYSDDLGQTWVDFAVEQPTTATAGVRGMVFGSDGPDNGVFVVERTVDPTNMTYRWAWEWSERLAGLQGFAYRGFRDPETGIVYVGFIGNIGQGAVIAASDGAAAGGVWRWNKTATSNGDGVRNVMVAGDLVVASVRDPGDSMRTLVGTRSVRSASSEKIMLGVADFDPVVGSPQLGGIGSTRPRRRWSLPDGSTTAVAGIYAIPSSWRSVNVTFITAGMGSDLGQVLLIVRWAPVDTGNGLGAPSALSVPFNPLGSSVVSRTTRRNLALPKEGHLWVERSGSADDNSDGVALLGVMLEPGN